MKFQKTLHFLLISTFIWTACQEKSGGISDELAKVEVDSFAVHTEKHIIKVDTLYTELENP
jgi:hypothetical protein